MHRLATYLASSWLEHDDGGVVGVVVVPVRGGCAALAHCTVK